MYVTVFVSNNNNDSNNYNYNYNNNSNSSWKNKLKNYRALINWHEHEKKSTLLRWCEWESRNVCECVSASESGGY